jgi:hypothetical protein
MGVVFRARDARLDRDVAIKALPEALRADSGRLRRFEQEARAAGALNHPNLLVVYDVGSHEGTPYLVTELLEGQTLRELLHAGPLTPRRAVDFALQVARGLAAAHDHGIVHRDIKPENVLVTAKDRVKLVDFGLAKAVGPTGKAPSDAPAGTLTESGAILGTAGYMSPEQVRGNGVDARSDLFAFGAVLYEMLTGEQAFEGATPVERSYAILRSEPRELGRLATRATPELAALVRRCLAKSPEERFASAHELVSALEGLAAELTTTGERPLARPTRESASARDERPKRARTALLVGLAAVLGAALAVGVTRSLEAPSVAASPAKAPEPETATVTRVTFRPAEIGGARFSSDGKRVIYDQRTFEHGTRIYESAIGGPSQRALNDTALRVFAVSKTGELAVGSRPEKSASAKGLMLSRLVPGGAPRDLTDGVLSAEWSPDGATLAIVRRTAAGARVELPIGTTLFETDGWISTLRFSPKGDTLAVLHHPIENDDRGTVELIRVDGSQTVLTEPFWSADGLAWLPSGEELWFAAAKQSGARAIYGVTLGGEVRRIYQAPGPLSLLDIDHEGRVLIRSDDPRSRMMAFSANDGRGVELSWFDASLPVSLSADGRMLLFMEGREAAGSEIQVFLRSTDGSPATHLGEGIAFALSPDARWALVSPKAPFGNLVLVPTGAGEPQELPPRKLRRRRVRGVFSGRRPHPLRRPRTGTTLALLHPTPQRRTSGAAHRRGPLGSPAPLPGRHAPGGEKRRVAAGDRRCREQTHLGDRRPRERHPRGGLGTRWQKRTRRTKVAVGRRALEAPDDRGVRSGDEELRALGRPRSHPRGVRLDPPSRGDAGRQTHGDGVPPELRGAPRPRRTTVAR